MLKATQGQVVWLARTGTQMARIWQRPDDKRTWTQIRDPGDYQPLYQFFSPQPAPDQATAPDQQTAADTTCRLTVGTATLTPVSRDGDTAEYHLASALNAHLQALRSPAAEGFITFGGEATSDKEAEAILEAEAPDSALLLEASGPVTIPLTFSALGLKQITVFPPRIEYSPPTA